VIALYDVVKVGEFEGDEGEVMEAGLIKYVSFSADGILDLEDCENLLGYEIDGDQQTWEREIKKYFDKIKRGQETRELHRQRVIELQKHCGDVVSGVFDRSYRERPACTEAKEEFKRLMGTVEKEG
jgi:CBS domain containing-hemolysin-like protein